VDGNPVAEPALHGEAGGGQSYKVFFSKEFVIDYQPLEATGVLHLAKESVVLRFTVVDDYVKAEVNGHLVTLSDSPADWTVGLVGHGRKDTVKAVDITRHLSTGTNTVKVEAKNGAGTGALRGQVEVDGNPVAKPALHGEAGGGQSYKVFFCKEFVIDYQPDLSIAQDDEPERL
jgi:hypothetical protein